MADSTAQQPKAALSTPFPAPPPFYKQFTNENVRQFRRLQKRNKTNSPNDYPPELRYQLPPEPPIDGKYQSFGHTIDLHTSDPTLADAGIEQLFPDHPSVRLNPRPHLIALARSLLTTFLALTGVLSQNPELFEEKTADLQTIVINMHDLINQYRPHQARETLILMTEERIDRLRAEVKEIENGAEKMQGLLKGLQTSKLTNETKLEIESAKDDIKSKAPESLSQTEKDALRHLQAAAWGTFEELDT